jgi:hypothetical protein
MSQTPATPTATTPPTAPASVLPRTRLALRAGRAEVTGLRQCAPDPLVFRDAFIRCIGMVQRVGPVLDDETRGRRTAAFSTWWQSTRAEPLLQYLTGVRNDEFKGGKTRVRPAFSLTMRTDSPPVRLRLVFRGQIESYITVDKPLPPGVEERAEWTFVDGRFDGQNVFSLLESHLSWLANVVSQAENLVEPKKHAVKKAE